MCSGDGLCVPHRRRGGAGVAARPCCASFLSGVLRLVGFGRGLPHNSRQHLATLGRRPRLNALINVWCTPRCFIRRVQPISHARS